MAPSQSLLDFVPDHLKPLKPLEEKLLEGAPLGREISDFESGEPIDKAKISEEQSVRSELLAWLLTNPDAHGMIHHKGISLRGARLGGKLDLEDARVEQPLRIRECIIEEEMILTRGKYKLLDFSASHTKGIDAYRVHVHYNFSMDKGFKADGGVNLFGANIGGDLDCSGSEFENPNGIALNGGWFTVQGTIFLGDGFKAKGEVNLSGANIRSGLDCSGGEFENLDGTALSGNRLTAQGAIFLGDGFKAIGEVSLFGANIGGDLICRGGQIENPKGTTLNLGGFSAQGQVLIGLGFKSKGEVSLIGANIEGVLGFIGGDFENPDGIAIYAEVLTTKSTVTLGNGFKAKGVVILHGANIGGDLDCSGGDFENLDGYALSGEVLTARGAIYLNHGFKALGLVSFVGANIGGDLDCSGGDFENPKGIALDVERLTTKSAVILGNGFRSKGEVNITGANIGGGLDCTWSKFENLDGYAFRGEHLNVARALYWRNMIKKPMGLISLENASIENIYDDEDSWPESGYLSIDGLTYGPFASTVPANSKSRLQWLNLRSPNDVSVQPYEQLISVFRQMGLEDDAREVAIAKQKFIRKQLIGLTRLWSWILDVTISYGYKPQKVIFLFIIPIILIGFFVFSQADFKGVMEPIASPDTLSAQTLLFDPLAYSLDVFLPIVDLHQESTWKPDASATYGIFIQYYMYFHILAGWFFTTLAVAAVTGLVRKD